MCDRPIPQRHRIIFYLGHLEAFDWNLLAQRAFGLQSFHRTFDQLFAFGIDPTDGGLPSDTPADWPEREEIEGYNWRMRNELDRALERALARPEEGHPQLIPMLHVAIEHRLMHAETLAYILHQLPYERKMIPSSVDPPAPGPRPPAPASQISIAAGQAQLGIPPGAPFGWDNEFQRHTVQGPAFSIASHKITNREYLDFVREGAGA